jgi:replicative DNA helicase
MEQSSPIILNQNSVNDQNRELPHNLEAEQQLLGALIKNNTLIDGVSTQGLKGFHFYESFHEEVYEKITQMNNNGKAVTILFLKTLFETNDAFDSDSYFISLVANAAHSLVIKDVANEIYELSLRRQLIQTAENLEHSSYALNEDREVSEIIEDTEIQLYEIDQKGQTGKSFYSFEDSVVESLNAAASAYESDDGLAGLSTGFSDLDKAVGGLQKSDLIILAGRPAMGKTALASNIAFNIAKKFGDQINNDNLESLKENSGDDTFGAVAFFSLEMSAEQLSTRIISDQAGVSSSDVRQGKIDEREIHNYMKVAEDLKNLPLYIDQTGAIPIGVLSSRARRLSRTLKQKKQDLSLIVVDYLQLATTGSDKYRGNVVQEISQITQGLKALAKELNVPVIALSQLSRNVESRDNKRPQLSDLRDSGAIEQDADIVMFVYREEYYLRRDEPDTGTEQHIDWQNKMTEAHGKASVLIEKHRHGAVKSVDMQFTEKFTRFSDLARDEYIPERME